MSGSLPPEESNGSLAEVQVLSRSGAHQGGFGILMLSFYERTKASPPVTQCPTLRSFCHERQRWVDSARLEAASRPRLAVQALVEAPFEAEIEATGSSLSMRQYSGCKAEGWNRP